MISFLYSNIVCFCLYGCVLACRLYTFVSWKVMEKFKYQLEIWTDFINPKVYVPFTAGDHTTQLLLTLWSNHWEPQNEFDDFRGSYFRTGEYVFSYGLSTNTLPPRHNLLQTSCVGLYTIPEILTCFLCVYRTEWSSTMVLEIFHPFSRMTHDYYWKSTKII